MKVFFEYKLNRRCPDVVNCTATVSCDWSRLNVSQIEWGDVGEGVYNILIRGALVDLPSEKTTEPSWLRWFWEVDHTAPQLHVECVGCKPIAYYSPTEVGRLSSAMNVTIRVGNKRDQDAEFEFRLGSTTDDAGWEPAGTAGWQTQTAFLRTKLGGGVHRTGSGRMGHIVTS